MRLHAYLQLIQGTAHDNEIIEVIRQLIPHLQTLKPEAKIQVAAFAYQAGENFLAQEILHGNIDDISDEHWLGEGLEVATALHNNHQIELFDSRFSLLFPHSVRLRENRDRRLLMNCRERFNDQFNIFTSAGFTKNHQNIQSMILIKDPDYSSICEEAIKWGEDWLELTVVCCALHARSTGKPREAANAVSFVSPTGIYGRQATQVLIWSIKSMMLRELVPEAEYDNYRVWFQSAFRFLAHNPADSSVRLGLISLISPEACGDMGIPIIALTMLDIAQQGVRLLSREMKDSNARKIVINDEILASIKNGFVWLNELGGGEPGVTILPREKLVANPDDVIIAIEQLLHLASGRDGENIDLEYMKKLVLLACTICPHSIDKRDDDIRFMRQLASQFAVEGMFQQARNYAESILLMGQSNAYRRRLAWQAFADIYHRCHNSIIAMVGLACAMSVDIEVETADLWHEVYTIHRVLRDLKLYQISRRFLPVMQSLLVKLGFDAESDPRYVNAELGLRLNETNKTDIEAINCIMSDAVVACKREIDNRNHLLPLAMLLAQTVLKAKSAGINITSETQLILDTALSNIGATMSNLVRIVSAEKSTIKDLLEIYNGIERASYSSDIARDNTLIEVATRRFLDSSSNIAPEELIVAAEILADHSVLLVGDTPFMTSEWPIQYASKINQAGISVAFLSLDINGELIVNMVSDGQAYTIEQPKYEKSFRQRFNKWLQDYPLEYGRVDRSQGNNIFYMSMEKLDIHLPAVQKLIIVAEPFLQQLTSNLVLLKTDDSSFSYFAGTKTAIGIVPSLSWLSSISTSKRSSRTSYKAWISVESNSTIQDISVDNHVDHQGYDQQPTLDIAFSRLSGCFEEFGFEVDNSRKLPISMNDASLAVVTAHGSLNMEGRYLHTIRDDDGLIETPSALAAALTGVELVILFVCSGGRIDKNPWDNSTTSLSKQLLNNGCRAVIASPWPLNVIVTYNWLDPFLRAWDEGATVLDATQIANIAVASRLGDVPQYSLAMRVYGDVLLHKMH